MSTINGVFFFFFFSAWVTFLNDDVVEKYRNFLDVDDQEENIPDLWRSFGGDDDG